MDRSDSGCGDTSFPRHEGTGIVRFGRFTMLPDRKALLLDAVVVPLGARGFDILCFLVAHRDRFNSSSRIRDHVWCGLLVADNNVSVQIWRLRRCLAAGSDGVETIVSLPGHGYRFVAPVSLPVATPAPTPPGAAPVDAGRTTTVLATAMRHRPFRRWPLRLSLVLLAVGCFSLGMLIRMPSQSQSQAALGPARALSSQIASPSRLPAHPPRWLDADDENDANR